MAEFNPEFSPGDQLSGQSYDTRRNITAPYVQEMLPYSGDANTARVTGEENELGVELTPQDANQAQSRTYNIAAIQAAMAGIVYSWPSVSDVPLPDVLTGLSVSFNKNSGTGSSSHPAGQQGATFVGGGSLSINPRAHAQGSASIIPDVQPQITSIWSRNLPTLNYAFYALGSITRNAVLARVTTIINAAKTVVTITVATPAVVSWTANGLANGDTVMFTTTGALPTGLLPSTIYFVVNVATDTFQVSATLGGSAINTTGSQSGVHSAVAAVKPLPVFKTAFYTITAIGQQVSVSADADSVASLNSNFDATSRAASFAWGNGSSKETGLTVRTLRVGPVINALITGYTTGDTQATSATVVASTIAIVLNGSTVVNAITNAPTATSGTATGAILPTSIPATSITAIPIKGLYLTDTNSSIDEYGEIQVHASVVDFSIFA